MMQNKEEINRINEDREFLLKRREFLDEYKFKITESFDKYLLSFSTGSLYLSIYFTSGFKNPIQYSDLLVTGWILLIVSIFSSLFSFVASKKAFNQQIDEIDTELKKLNGYKIEHNKNNCLPKMISFFNNIAIAAFILGIIFLSVFYFKNIGVR